MRKNYKVLWLAFLVIIALLFFSCRSMGNRRDDAFPLTRSTSSIRLENIRNQLHENPINALNLIFIYKEIYSSQSSSDDEDWLLLAEFEAQAIENLRSLQRKAIEEERFDDAVSLSRSLASIGIAVEYSGLEPNLILAGAKKKLADGDILGAFLSAAKSHEMQPLDFASSILFLQKAVEVRQRRSAAFFLAAAEAAGGSIPAELRQYAQGRDSVSDMINGVATVIVDRGMRIDRGRGIPDRVLGSAFFVDASGLLITNHHVIESMVDPRHRGGARLFIRMGDATSPRIPARVIGWDQTLDLALIRTEFRPEYVFSLIDYVSPRVGDTVLAIGSPLGLEKTVSSGIVSAVGRRIPFLPIGDVIQIDAAVSQGNSGGPLIDSEGRLVGVVFAGVPNHQGLNFAVPAERLAAALPAMIRGGNAQRSWLGMSLSETFRGAQIIYTAPNTPASHHLIREGTFIRSINGQTITASPGGLIPALQDVIFQIRPGELVAIETVDAEGAVRKNIVMTSARPDVPLLHAARIDRRDRITAPLFGMVVTPAGGGFFSPNFTVRQVVRGSIADEVGISENDPVSINRLRILENEGFAVLDITVRKRRMGFMEANMQLIAWLDSPDML